MQGTHVKSWINIILATFWHLFFPNYYLSFGNFPTLTLINRKSEYNNPNLKNRPISDIDWQFDSYMIVYMIQCHSPKSSHPLPLPLSPNVRYTHLCHFCCLAYRVIIAIFLNSIYMCYYTVLVFFFLAYFTLYNRLQFHPSHQNWFNVLFLMAE